MDSSSSLLPRHQPSSRNTDTDPLNSKSRRRRRPPPSARSKPPSQDRLVVVFITASAIFSLISISPFLFGNFPSHGTDDKDWLHKHGDGQGGVLNLAGNKTLLAWHHLMGQEKQRIADQKMQVGNKQDQQYASDINKHAQALPLARGVSGLPLSETPALVGAQHGSIQCPSPDGKSINMDKLAYWNEPQGQSDISFVTPFAPSDPSKQKRYVTFEPDRGGWNNIRMSLEIVIVFAAATGRTLVLPPDTPFYLLSKNSDGKKKKHHGFADFLDLESEALKRKVDIISMHDFLTREGYSAGDTNSNTKIFKIPGGEKGKKLWKSAEQCYYVAKSDRPCDTIYGFLRDEAYVPELQAGRDCLIFDLDKQSAKDAHEYTDKEIFELMPDAEQRKVTEFCDKRNPIFFGSELASSPLVHFHAGEKHHRLLNHFYTFLYFTDTKLDHYFKRFVRDFLHYTDTIWCAAGRVLQLLEEDAMKESGRPTFSSMHVRRGDFQYKKVKITADDWYNNTKDIIQQNEIVYIATDEKDSSFFVPLAKHYNLRFLSNYSVSAGLTELDPNLMGMIDTIIASRGRLFVGTWFSTFTGYINRLRGYYGMSGTTSYYSTPERKFNTHKWEIPQKVMTAREWPEAWVGIDGDEFINEEQALKS